MSAKQRAAAEALRAKYANVFGVPKHIVRVEYLDDEDARVYADSPGAPVWTLGVPTEPRWVRNTKVRTF